MSTLTITHEGHAYAAEVGTITATRLGPNELGIITAALQVNFETGGLEIEPFRLDKAGAGTAFGMDYLLRIIDVVRVDRWEDLVSEDVAVLFPGTGGWGERPIGIASTNGRRVLLFSEFTAAWKSRGDHTASA